MKWSILMSMMLTFGFYFSSQVHCAEDGENDLEMVPLMANQKENPGLGLTWREIEPHLYDFYTEGCSCQSCCDSVYNDRCSCMGCVARGICGCLFTGCAVAVSYTAYHYNQIQKCIASCGRGYQGFGWCTPDNTCFNTYTDCENSCHPSGNAYTIGLYSSIAGLVVTGVTTMGMCLAPCVRVVQYCKDLDDKNDNMRENISRIGAKYLNKDDLLRDEDIKTTLLSIVLEARPDLRKKLNKQQQEALSSIQQN